MPEKQSYFGSHPDDAHFGEYATLAELRKQSDAEAMQWLTAQLAELSSFSGSKNMDVRQLRMTAITLATEYPWMKWSEYMLFFYRFKAGRYGKFYGAVDPLVITTAMQDFARERNEAWFRHEQEEREERKRREAEANPPMSYEEYSKRNGVKKRNPLETIKRNL